MLIVLGQAASLAPVYAILAVLILIGLIVVALTGIRIIQPYEQGLWIVLGKYRGKKNPGFNWVYPLVSQVIKLDLRTQVLDVPRQEVITKDNSPTNVDAVVYLRVVTPEKAFFEVTNYRHATIALAQTTLRSIVGDMDLDEILYNRDRINHKLRDILDEATTSWGVRVESVEIREVDPVGRVKAAMEEQTSAERERRAAILRADGQKRSAILTAEGEKRSRILQAEGVRTAQVLEAEGRRVAQILERQGEAQGLRILALGGATLDQKSLTVLSLDALKKLGEGQATKIVLPFEVTSLLASAAHYIRSGAQEPPRESASVRELEAVIGDADRVLGRIPSPDDLTRTLEDIEKEAAAEAERVEALAAGAAKKGKIDQP